ncbi:Acetyl-CoA biotin carboxyl carrier [Rubripirellula tenax]|uniref:Biotin carboxyl carrier protein of acetyl-CoA carboxylase n=1 Tax=Rubripirellula tenax TaxID=2528015 RepID=A0A5C6EMS0_9BACT|nr:acetyl-CoA carboxylase biotin carboxyl carrier protein [Rubripirellula tenax]TWU48599.1 Acetyl-CoA biotin carboxyl carrier [Rubripirellula tenax]
MSKGGKPKDVFDVERIRQIIQLMEEHDLSEVDLQQGDEKIKLGRGAKNVYSPPPVAAPAYAASAPAAAAGGSPPEDAGTFTINAPMVGTFYSKATPESPSFVKVGDHVGPDTVVCIVEAMKVFNEIPAECSGTIVAVLASDQEPVDFGKPMFRVKPDA